MTSAWERHLRGDDMRERLLEVGDEVGGILEADGQANQRPARPLAHHAVGAARVDGHREALEAAPAVAQLEALERVDHAHHLRAAAARELEGEEPGGTAVVAL